MEHLLNEPIEARYVKDIKHHLDGRCVKLCFIYHKPLDVSYRGVEIMIHYHSVVGSVTKCKELDSGDWKVEVTFYDEVEGFKVRMLEQYVRIEEYHRKHPNMTVEQASQEWVRLFGSKFSKE